MYSAILLHQDKSLILGKLVFLQADRYGVLVLAAWDLLTSLYCRRSDILARCLGWTLPPRQQNKMRYARNGKLDVHKNQRPTSGSASALHNRMQIRSNAAKLVWRTTRARYEILHQTLLLQ